MAYLGQEILTHVLFWIYQVLWDLRYRGSIQAEKHD